MNIQHLKYAVEVAKTGSISKAAETLYINQPNLSRAIRELEGSLGITLFERSAKGMTSTREGREFLRNAEKVLAELDEIENYYKKGAAASGGAGIGELAWTISINGARSAKRISDFFARRCFSLTASR